MFQIKEIVYDNETYYYISCGIENKMSLFAKFISIFTNNIEEAVEMKNKVVASMVDMQEDYYINKMIGYFNAKVKDNTILFVNRRDAMNAVAYLNAILLNKKLVKN